MLSEGTKIWHLLCLRVKIQSISRVLNIEFYCNIREKCFKNSLKFSNKISKHIFFSSEYCKYLITILFSFSKWISWLIHPDCYWLLSYLLCLLFVHSWNYKMALVLHKSEIRKSFHKISRFCPKLQENIPWKGTGIWSTTRKHHGIQVLGFKHGCVEKSCHCVNH